MGGWNCIVIDHHHIPKHSDESASENSLMNPILAQQPLFRPKTFVQEDVFVSRHQKSKNLLRAAIKKSVLKKKAKEAILSFFSSFFYRIPRNVFYCGIQHYWSGCVR